MKWRSSPLIGGSYWDSLGATCEPHPGLRAPGKWSFFFSSQCSSYCLLGLESHENIFPSTWTHPFPRRDTSAPHFPGKNKLTIFPLVFLSRKPQNKQVLHRLTTEQLSGTQREQDLRHPNTSRVTAYPEVNIPTNKCFFYKLHYPMVLALPYPLLSRTRSSCGCSTATSSAHWRPWQPPGHRDLAVDSFACSRGRASEVPRSSQPFFFWQ